VAGNAGIRQALWVGAQGATMDGFAKCDQPRIVPFAALAFNAASFAQSMDRSSRKVAAGVCTALVRAIRRISIAN